MIPVSYTHLDVYKRQGRRLVTASYSIRGQILTVSKLFRYAPAGEYVCATGARGARTLRWDGSYYGPVSYKHLDVYKRQEEYNMYEYDDEGLDTFLKKQTQLLSEEFADTPEAAEEFLEDCMACLLYTSRCV